MLTQDSLKQILIYNPDTGIFNWKVGGKKKSVIRPAGTKHSKGYIVISIMGRRFFAHRLAWLYVTGDWPKNQIDHRNGERDANHFGNLRDVTHSENQQNQRVARGVNKSGLLGVSKNGKKWRASIWLDSKVILLGQFNTPELAHIAYITEKRKIHNTCTI